MALQERAVRTRRTILLAAAAVFAEEGYESATIAQILQRAGVTKGALYFHFPSKRELAEAVLADQLGAVPEVPAQDLVLQEALDTTFLVAHLLSRGDPLVRGSIRLTVEPGVLCEDFDSRAPLRGWVARSAGMLSRAKAHGELLPHIDVDAAARMFVAAFTGVQLLSKILTGHADLAERTADMERHLMASIAVPAVLLQLDMAPDRGARVHAQLCGRANRPLARPS
ncbi:ScbR family autoregulator-binding transcription factor [Streptomyces sp. NPDC049915]|uniref:ScbR family autoregulator-binding transcription factor n=1 Tax=Streptomyces sp. NPDC049915 TaxID=3155510 RepID=UPI003421C646